LPAAGTKPADLGRVGRYRLVDRIAVTAMSEVFRAEVTDDDGVVRRVALKRVRHDLASSDEMNRMFLDEAAIARSLEHGSVVRTLDFGLDGDAAYLVMEFVDGWDLGRVLARGGPLAGGVALFVAHEMLEGLGHIHARLDDAGAPMGLVHRDISVENVLCTRDGEVKIADFGIAKARTNRALTGPGIMKGKIGSMSPEQVLGRPLDGRSDLFSVGVVLYRMLTARAPFEAPTDAEVLVMTTKGEFAPIGEGVPGPVRALVESALAADPAARPQAATAMAQRIEEIAEELSLRMTPGALRKLLAERMKEPAAPKLDGILRRAARARAEPEQTEPSRRRARWPYWMVGGGAAIAALLFWFALGPGLQRAAPRAARRPRPEASLPATTAPVPETTAAPAAPEMTAAPVSAKGRAKAPVGTATLTINVTPWARVILDGRVIDPETPTRLTIDAGRHTLRLENPGLGLSETTTFTVGAGGTHTVGQW